MRATFAAFVVAMAALPVTAAPTIVGPSQIPPYKLARLSLDVPAGSAVIWDVSPDEVADVEESGNRLILTGPPGRYVIKARVIRLEAGALQIQASRHVLVIGDGPPVPPPVPPPPAPIDPISPLAKAIKDAATKDGWPAAQLRELAIGFGVCANVTTAGKTASALEQARAKALASAVPDGVPVSVYAVCAAKQAAVNSFLPISDPEHVVTVDEAAKVKAIYTELADACREAAK